jgi:repressor LexA
MNSKNSERNKVLGLMKGYKKANGTLPSLSYIANELGYKHKSKAQYHVNTIIDSGLLNSRSKTSMVDIPLVADISCGPAVLAEENIEAYIPVDVTSLSKKNSKYFFLRANGDSMNQAGINPGDYVLIRQQATANLKDIVVALIGDDATLKQLDKTQDGIPVLNPQSDNIEHKPRVMLEDFSILGIMERVLTPSARRYVV